MYTQWEMLLSIARFILYKYITRIYVNENIKIHLQTRPRAGPRWFARRRVLDQFFYRKLDRKVPAFYSAVAFAYTPPADTPSLWPATHDFSK